MSTLETDEEEVCPTCGRDDFASAKGMKQHHAKTHGESIAGETCECEKCGDTYDVRPGRKETTRFCSKKCKGSWQSENLVGEDALHWEGGKIELECEWCGDVYNAHQYEEDTRDFCSQECTDKWMSTRSGDDIGVWKGGKVSIHCNQCDNIFEVKPYRAEEAQFCSRECQSEWRSENIVGEDHHLWKSDTDRIYGPGWNNQKRHRVRKRDDFECQECGVSQDEHIEEMGRKLDVHHITPAREIDDPEKRNAMSNLTTLCRSCHLEVEPRN